MGAIIFLSKDQKMGEVEGKLAQTAAGFLGKQMDSKRSRPGALIYKKWSQGLLFSCHDIGQKSEHNKDCEIVIIAGERNRSR